MKINSINNLLVSGMLIAGALGTPSQVYAQGDTPDCAATIESLNQSDLGIFQSMITKHITIKRPDFPSDLAQDKITVDWDSYINEIVSTLESKGIKDAILQIQFTYVDAMVGSSTTQTYIIHTGKGSKAAANTILKKMDPKNSSASDLQDYMQGPNENAARSLNNALFGSLTVGIPAGDKSNLNLNEYTSIPFDMKTKFELIIRTNISHPNKYASTSLSVGDRTAPGDGVPLQIDTIPGSTGARIIMNEKPLFCEAEG
jgi:hypothetical protein